MPFALVGRARSMRVLLGAHAVPASLALAANRLTTLPILERIQRLRLLVPQERFELPTVLSL
jgi:hypothetical protein